MTDQMVLTIGYDVENLSNPEIQKHYRGEITTDRYGRKVPKHAHGTANLERMTSSTERIVDAVMELYDRIVDDKLLVRRINLVANHIVREDSVARENVYEQLDLFTDYEERQKLDQQEEKALQREKQMQHAMLDIKKKFGKNAIIKGMNLQEGATMQERNRQIGGHKA